MIVLHSVTKVLKPPGGKRRLVLNQIDWIIPPRTQYVIFGQKGAGKTTLVNILGGSRFPSHGWVERKGSICHPRGLAQVAAANATPRAVGYRLAHLYHARHGDVVTFIARFAAMEAYMDLPLAHLPRDVRLRFNNALIYAVPFDLYLFDEKLAPKGAFGERCTNAIRARCQDASLVFTTSRAAPAKALEGAAGGVLHDAKLILFDTAAEAMKFFSELPPANNPDDFADQDDSAEDEEEEILF